MKANNMKRTSRNKEAAYIWEKYQRATDTSVMNCYRTRPSDYKIEAENDILQRMQEENGSGYKVTSHSGFVFTCGYTRQTEAGETVLEYFTRDRHETILVDGEYRHGYTR